ncbi:MAG: AMP-binding protein [Pseudodonghicola sp.]
MTYNLGEMLAHRAYLAPRHEGFIGPDYRYSYAEVNQRCDRLAAWLHRQGIASGDRVAVYGKNTEALATTIFATAKADGITVVLNWRLQVEELVYILNDSGARVLFYDAAFAPMVEELRQRTGLEIFIRHGGTGSDPDYAEIVADDSLPPCPRAERRGGDTAIIMYTSGTTGRPKGAMLTHDNFLAAGHGTSSTIDWLDSHRFLLVAPIFHIGGLMPLTTSVQKGTTVYFLPDFDPVAVWQVIARERITTMMSVPAMLGAMLAIAAKTEVDASSLINITCGASVVPEAMIAACAEMGVSVQQVYGLTEVTGALTFWKAAMDPTKSASHGKPAFLNEVMIADLETGRPAPAGMHGEVMARGAVVFAGYWNNADATNSAIRDGWFATGDVGYFDTDGFLYLVDWLKDMIISGGENIYPAEVEKVILAHGGVAEVSVVGRPDERWGEVPVAFVVRAPDAHVQEQDIIDDCRSHLAHFKCPKTVVFLDALPRNGIGKILKADLREMAKADLTIA